MLALRIMRLIDIGINLGHDSYTHDRAAVMQRAAAAGVDTLIATGAALAANPEILALARAHPGRVWATAGVHPHHASSLEAQHESGLRTLWQQPEVVAVGECGLDYFRNYSPRADQLRAFAWQLQWGLESGKPLFLHQRDAHDDFVALLREQRGGNLHGVAHCFTGTQRELADCLALGLHIGITGWICDERRGLQLRELVKQIPAGRLLLETDGPYLLPRDYRPVPAARRNEPALLAHVAATVAACRGESLEACAVHTTAAACALFGIL
jgi:TatD DNase family protein